MWCSLIIIVTIILNINNILNISDIDINNLLNMIATMQLAQSPLSMASNLHHHVISIWSKQMVEEHFCMWPTDFSACVAFSLFCLCAFSTAIIMAGSHWPTVQTVCSCFSLELKSWQVPELRLSGQQHEQYSFETLTTILTIENLNSWQSLLSDN